MKHSDYEKQLEHNPEYQEAKAELELAFAFGDAVLRARLKKGWTQTELARRVGTRQANISRIEAGLANPTLELVQKVCRALEIGTEFKEKERKSQHYMIFLDSTSNWSKSFEPCIQYIWSMEPKYEWSTKPSSTYSKKEVVRR